MPYSLHRNSSNRFAAAGANERRGGGLSLQAARRARQRGRAARLVLREGVLCSLLSSAHATSRPTRSAVFHGFSPASLLTHTLALFTALRIRQCSTLCEKSSTIYVHVVDSEACGCRRRARGSLRPLARTRPRRRQRRARALAPADRRTLERRRRTRATAACVSLRICSSTRTYFSSNRAFRLCPVL